MKLTLPRALSAPARAGRAPPRSAPGASPVVCLARRRQGASRIAAGSVVRTDYYVAPAVEEAQAALRTVLDRPGAAAGAAALESLDVDVGTSVHAVILAGGGSGDNPLCARRAAGALPVGGSFKVIDLAISSCLQAGIEKVYVLTQFNSSSLNTYLSRTYKPSTFGSAERQGWIEVLTATQTPTCKTWRKGSADAVRASLPTMLRTWHGAEVPDNFVILSAEGLGSMDIKQLLATHLTSDADISMCTTAVDEEAAGKMGLVTVDPELGWVRSFVEKPHADDLARMAQGSKDATADKPFEASMGAYVFKREVLVDLLEMDLPTDARDCIGYDILPTALAKGYHIGAVHETSTFTNVNNLAAYFDYNMRLVRGEECFSQLLSSLVGVSGRVLPPTRFTGTTQTSAAMVGEGCLLHDASLNNVVIGYNTLISGPADIADSIILGSDLQCSVSAYNTARRQKAPTLGFGKNLKMRGAIADTNATVGDDCVLVNAGNVQEATFPASMGGVMIRDGIIVLPRNCVVPDGTII